MNGLLSSNPVFIGQIILLNKPNHFFAGFDSHIHSVRVIVFHRTDVYNTNYNSVLLHDNVLRECSFTFPMFNQQVLVL